MLFVLLSGSAMAWLPTGAAMALWAYLYGGLFVPRVSAPADNDTGLTVMTFNALAHTSLPSPGLAPELFSCARHATGRPHVPLMPAGLRLANCVMAITKSANFLHLTPGRSAPSAQGV